MKMGSSPEAEITCSELFVARDASSPKLQYSKYFNITVNNFLSINKTSPDVYRSKYLFLQELKHNLAETWLKNCKFGHPSKTPRKTPGSKNARCIIIDSYYVQARSCLHHSSSATGFSIGDFRPLVGLTVRDRLP